MKDFLDFHNGLYKPSYIAKLHQQLREWFDHQPYADYVHKCNSLGILYVDEAHYPG